jgi:DNA-binding PadR family transcriptional regulator
MARGSVWEDARFLASAQKSAGTMANRRVEEGSLYPELQRMAQAGWLKAEWETSENNRRARLYWITAAGRRQLAEEERMISNFSQTLPAAAVLACNRPEYAAVEEAAVERARGSRGLARERGVRAPAGSPLNTRAKIHGLVKQFSLVCPAPSARRFGALARAWRDGAAAAEHIFTARLLKLLDW